MDRYKSPEEAAAAQQFEQEGLDDQVSQTAQAASSGPKEHRMVLGIDDKGDLKLSAKPNETTEPSKNGEQETGGVENLDEYEREKIERTLLGAEHLVAVMKNYLEMVKYADENGIRLAHKPNLSGIRYPNAIFDPIRKDGLTSMAGVFEHAMTEIAKDIHFTHKSAIEKRMYK